jgi:hypothetical protein
VRELDFLPQSYHDRLHRRLQTRRNVLMCLGLALAMACLHGLNLTRINSVQAALTDLHNGSGGWQSAKEQLAAMERRRESCRQRLELINRLEDAAPLDGAIGEVTGLLSESMALTAVQIDAGPADPANTSKPDKSAMPTLSTTRVRLTGVAATDVEVGIFLGKLSGCQLFSDVTLSYSRDARNQGRKMREFEVKFTLRPVEEAQ